jgi:hypothetical protein
VSTEADRCACGHLPSVHRKRRRPGDAVGCEVVTHPLDPDTGKRLTVHCPCPGYRVVEAKRDEALREFSQAPELVTPHRSDPYRDALATDEGERPADER